MNVFEFAETLMGNGDLESKLLSSKLVTSWDIPAGYNILEFKNPVRDSRLEFSTKQIKFPKKTRFKEESARAIAMHSFANHELLAIEMMAAAILKFPIEGDKGLKFRKILVSTIEDEQKHLGLYVKRIQEMNTDFGDLPLNDFFWRQMEYLDNPEEYFALMSLTFEAANLDFATFYEEVFNEVEDVRSANIMNVVLKDEISHVAVGANWLKAAKGDSDLFDYYKSLLPEKMTPSRAKGIVFCSQPRIVAGLDQAFVSNVQNYKDDFKVTNRREWKS